METVFVTGINGLLGTNLVNLLLESGYRVKGLVRNISSYEGKRDDNLQLIKGNLFEDLSDVISGADYVIHIAATTRQDISDYFHYRQVNTVATIQLHRRAVECKVKKFIFVSTANTIGHGSIDKPGVETNINRKPFSNSLYAQSKKEAEDYLLKNNDEIETVIVNPTFMLGAYDTKPSSGKIITTIWKKKVIFYPSGGKNFVHVKDVAKGILLSMKKGKNGERYLLANENLSYREFFKKVNTIAGQRALMVKIPKPVLLGVGIIGDVLRKLNVKTSLSSVNMQILCVDNYYSNQKSRTELGVEYTLVNNAIRDAVRYFESKQLT